MMQFQIRKALVIEALQKIMGVVERRHNIPILANILVQVKPGQIKFTATDMEIEISSYLHLEDCTAQGETTVPGRKLFDIVKTFSDEAEIRFEVDSNECIVKSSRSVFTLKTLPAIDFPQIEFKEAQLEFSFESVYLARLIEQVSFSVANQDVRYYLNGMLMEVSPKQLKVASTDGHRLSQAIYEIVDDLPFHQCIIPRKAVLELQKILAHSQEKVDIAVGANFISMKRNDFTFTTKLIEGKFPSYNSVIPQDLSRSLSISRDTLKQTLARTSVLLNDKFNSILCSMSNNQLIIDVKNIENDAAHIELEAEFNGADLEVSYNVSYFLDVLNHLDQEQVYIQFSGSNQSALIQQNHDQIDSLYVIMPMFI